MNKNYGVKNLKKYENGWEWDTFYTDNYTAKVIENHYKTGKDGYGLWHNGQQIIGTCQYKACDTESGQYKKALKYLENLTEGYRE